MGAETRDCPDCNHVNPVDAKVCEQCNFDFFAPTPPPVSTKKKRSIFDGILEDEPVIEDNLAEDDIVEEALELENNASDLNDIFSTEREEEEQEKDIQQEETEDKIEEEIDNEDDDDLEDDFELIFEKTTEETADSILKKANIPFEIVDTPILGTDNFDAAIEEDIAVETPEIIEEAEVVVEEDFIENTADILDEEVEEFDLETPPPINDLFEENPNDNLEEEIFQKFADAFEKQIKTEQNPTKYNEYVDRFEASDFKLSFEFRVKQLAEEVQKIRQDKSDLLQNEDDLLERAFTELTDYFIIRYCEDLNSVHLSENILQYQNIAAENIDLSNMILDYLDFDNENERVNFDFIKMPLKRLQNASKNYLFPEKGEKIFFICDQTMLGSGKEGFAMTEKAIYWKMQFENAERVYYKNLQTVEPQKNWITINDMFFNANPSLNVKLMKLLKKLKTVQRS